MSDLQLSPTLRRILLEALVISLFAVAVGLSLNSTLVLNAFRGKTVTRSETVKPAVPAESAAPAPVIAYPDPVELDEIDELLAEGAVLIDARNRDDYAESHLAGAISLPLGELPQRLAAFIARVPKQRVLIAYCNGFGCPDSFDLGVELLAEGYQEVRVFEGGYPQWRDAGRALEVGK